MSHNAPVGAKAEGKLRGQGEFLAELALLSEFENDQEQQRFVRRGTTLGAVDVQLRQLREPLVRRCHDSPAAASQLNCTPASVMRSAGTSTKKHRASDRFPPACRRA